MDISKTYPNVSINLFYPKGWNCCTSSFSEQIDGAFTFKDDDYLLEAKWQQTPVNAGELYKFSGKINGKRKNTLGLFISIDGFSTESVQSSNPDLRSLILMDGMDLDALLNDRIKLDDLLYRKRGHASETGNTYLHISKVLVP